MTTPESKMTSIAPSDLEDLRNRINHLKVVGAVRQLSLPVAAASAGVTLFTAPVVFPVVTSVVAAGLLAGKLYSDRQRDIIKQEIEGLRERGVNKSELDSLSTSANTVIVGGSST